MRDLANFNLSVALGVMGKTIGRQDACTIIRATEAVRRDVVDGLKVGYDQELLDGEQTGG